MTPGACTVIRDPPIDPEFGEIDTSLGVILKEVSTSEWLAGIPMSKYNFWEFRV